MTKLSVHTKIYDLIQEHPQIKEIMQELGFENIVNPLMLKTVGKVMTIKKGSELKKIDMNLIYETFKKYNYELEDINERVH